MARKHLALAQFVQATASLTKDSECVSCGKDGHEPNPDCHTHAPWDMRNDDAVETLHGLISNARRLNNQRSALSLEDAIHQIEQFGDTLDVSGRMCVLTGDEVQALVDFAREVIGLAVEDDDGKEPGYLPVAGQLDTDTIKRFDAIIRHHGFEELIQDGELDKDL